MRTAWVIVGLALASFILHAPVSAEPNAAPMPQQLYKYRTKDGRTAYTNILDEVPPDQRADHKVDLSHVSLNTEVGNELNQRLAIEHKELAASPYCEELKKAAAKTELEQLWDDYAPVIVCGGIIALLILMTPMMMRKVHPPEWARVLSKAIPTLFLVGGAMYGMQVTNKKIVETRKQLKPCLSETFDGLAGSADPNAERLSLVAQLKRDVEKFQQLAGQRNDELDKLLTEQ